MVDTIGQLDLSSIYQRYSVEGGEAIAPEVLLGLLFYGYATGVFSSRRIEKGTYENIPMRYVAGGLQPDHDTIAHFRKTFLIEIQELFVQILQLAEAVGVLHLGNLSIDGSKIHADASKSKAVSYKRLVEIQNQLRREVQELIELGEQADQQEVPIPSGLDIPDELAIREERLAKLARAKTVLEERAKERFEVEQAEYQTKLQEREAKGRKRQSGRILSYHQKPADLNPNRLNPGRTMEINFNFTDPESQVMKNSMNQGMDPHYNVQVAVDQETFLIVAPALSRVSYTGVEEKSALTGATTRERISPKRPGAPGRKRENGRFFHHSIYSYKNTRDKWLMAGSLGKRIKTRALVTGFCTMRDLGKTLPPKTVIWECTRACNMACIHCGSEKRARPAMNCPRSRFRE